MYIRKVKSRNSTCYQIGEKRRGKFILLRHVGCAVSPSAIKALHLKAKDALKEIKLEGQFPFFREEFEREKDSFRAKLTNWRITGYHLVFGKVYDAIGFPQTMLKDLTVARIVYPKSKRATARYMGRYLGINISEDRIYRFLDTLDEGQLFQTAYNFTLRKNSGKISLLFYDVTTLYFETDREDDFRRRGYSKDGKHANPQILIGLFVDQNGYPLEFGSYSGKTYEGHTFEKAVTSFLDRHKIKYLTVVADAGMLARENLSFLSEHRLGYIISARLKNLPLDITNVILCHNFTKKPFFRKKFEADFRDNDLIMTFSPNRAKKDQYNRNSQIKKLEAKLAQGKPLNRKSKYLAISGKEKIVGINTAKIEQDQKFDGLKGYFTNTNLSFQETVKQYKNLWRVEKAFRMSKNDLRERPVYHRRKRRIRAHLDLCFVSLLVMRETERKLAKIPCSLERAIELLGKVGEGEVNAKGLLLKIDSDIDHEAQLILNLW